LDEGTFIPRVSYGIARYFAKENELRGHGLIKPLAGIQKRVNMALSQVISTRERNGNEGILARRGMRLSSPGMLRGYPGHVVVWDTDPEAPDAEPKPFPARLMSDGVWTEIAEAKQQAKDIAGHNDFSTGKADIQTQWAASAIKQLNEADAERREQRTEELTSSYVSVWEHQLMLLREYVREDRPYSLMNKSTGEREEDTFVGSDIPPSTKLKVDEEPSFDETAYERDGIVQGINLGVILPDTPYKQYQIAKALGLPASITEQSSIQVNDATKKWYAFKEKQEIPAIDEHQDDHYLFFTTYGKELKGDWANQQKKVSNESAMLKMVAGWEDKLVQREAMEPVLAQIRLGTMPLLLQDPNEIARLQKEAAEPPLPNALEDRITYVWGKMVEKVIQDAISAMGVNMAMVGPTLPPQALQPPFDLKSPWFKFKALTEAHRLYDERKKSAAMGSPQTAAPGGVATPLGSQPMQGEQAGMVQ
jgi:hypothetical protein